MEALKEVITTLPDLGLDRSEAFESFVNKGVPSRRDEDWKYLSLKELSSRKLQLSNTPDTSEVLALNGKASATITEEPLSTLLFSNGVFLPGRSNVSNSEIIASNFEGLSESHKNRVEKFLGKLSADCSCSLTQLNQALISDAAIIIVPAGVSAPSAIEVVFTGSRLEEDKVTANRLLVVAEEDSEVEIIQRDVSSPKAAQTVITVCEIFAAKNSDVKHHRIQQESAEVTHISSVFIRQEEESNVASNTFSFGGKIARNQIFPSLLGENCNNFMRGVTISGEKQIIDTHTIIDHAVPNCESCEQFKTISGGQSQSNFAGTIIVRQDAQKTNAIQSNDSVLLSDTAKSYSRPQLKIWADDVRCTHGATIGELDADSLFYLRSRGIPEFEARKMLIEAFASSVLEDIDSPTVEKKLRSLILERLAALV